MRHSHKTIAIGSPLKLVVILDADDSRESSPRPGPLSPTPSEEYRFAQPLRDRAIVSSGESGHQI